MYSNTYILHDTLWLVILDSTTLCKKHIHTPGKYINVVQKESLQSLGISNEEAAHICRL